MCVICKWIDRRLNDLLELVYLLFDISNSIY